MSGMNMDPTGLLEISESLAKVKEKYNDAYRKVSKDFKFKLVKDFNPLNIEYIFLVLVVLKCVISNVSRPSQLLNIPSMLITLLVLKLLRLIDFKVLQYLNMYAIVVTLLVLKFILFIAVKE